MNDLCTSRVDFYSQEFDDRIALSKSFKYQTKFLQAKIGFTIY